MNLCPLIHADMLTVTPFCYTENYPRGLPKATPVALGSARCYKGASDLILKKDT